MFDQESIKEIVKCYSGLLEPHCEISAGAQKVYGPAMEGLARQLLDLPRIRDMLRWADFLVVHNAAFDKGFVRRIFPKTRTKRWYCSMTGINWSGRRGLHDLLALHGIIPDQLHRALEDIEGLLLLLNCKNWRGKTYFTELINQL